jgi:ankyrin repeat protein
LDREGATALVRASRCGQVGAARVLLASGADAGIRDATGRMAIDYARLFAFNELASLLQR